MDKCAVIVHRHQIHAFKKNGISDSVFCLTRNPLTKDEKPAPFNEEGRMHLTVTLLIECDFSKEKLVLNGGESKFKDYIMNICLVQKLAGGLIIDIEKITFEEIPENLEEKKKFIRKEMRTLLPGYLLLDRTDLLKKNLEKIKNENPESTIFDAWMNFISFKYSAVKNDETAEKKEIEWQCQEKISEGWFVPLNIGYRAISPLYPAGLVKNTRDTTTSFRFVESVYTIGQWKSPHRIDDNDFENIFWRYHADPESGWYLCKNNLFSEENNDNYFN